MRLQRLLFTSITGPLWLHTCARYSKLHRETMGVKGKKGEKRGETPEFDKAQKGRRVPIRAAGAPGPPTSSGAAVRLGPQPDLAVRRRNYNRGKASRGVSGGIAKWSRNSINRSEEH